MKLVLVRHGEANNEMDDSRRSLTEEGRNDIVRMTSLLHGTGWKFSEVRCSPVLRAAQTARQISESFRDYSGRELAIVEEHRLSPGVDPEGIKQMLTNYSPSDAAVWVFHMPDIARIASMILGLPDTSFYFPPGSMVGLNLPLPSFEGRSMLIWMGQPEYIRSLLPANP